MVGLTVDAPSVWGRRDAATAAARWFEADPELDLVVVLDDWAVRSGWSTGPASPGGASPTDRAQDPPVHCPQTVVAWAMARPAADRFDPLVCVDDRGHYVGVLRIEQLVHRLLVGRGG